MKRKECAMRRNPIPTELVFIVSEWRMEPLPGLLFSTRFVKTLEGVSTKYKFYKIRKVMQNIL